MQSRIVTAVLLSLISVAIFSPAIAAEKIVSVGSNTLQGVVEALSAAFMEQHQGMEFQVQAKGSGTAPEALLAATSQLAPMSRKMTPAEREAIEAKHGAKPLEFKVALDALAVYVHKDNPIKGLTLDQLGAVFSASPACSKGVFAESETISNWSDLAFSSLGKITPVGRDDNSGSYEFFKEQALCGGEYRPEVKQLADSRAVLDWVAEDISAIGYSGVGFRSDNVRMVALSAKPRSFEAPYYSYMVEEYKDSANLEKRYGWVVRGKYPLARYLYFYIRADLSTEVDLRVKEFVEFALSGKGQQIVHQAGYIPLPKKILGKERKRIAAHQ